MVETTFVAGKKVRWNERLQFSEICQPLGICRDTDIGVGDLRVASISIGRCFFLEETTKHNDGDIFRDPSKTLTAMNRSATISAIVRSSALLGLLKRLYPVREHSLESDDMVAFHFRLSCKMAYGGRILDLVMRN